MKNVFFNTDIDVYEILNSVNVGIWLMEYSKAENIYRFYGNETLARIMGLSKQQMKDLSSVQWFKYWYDRVDPYYLNDVQKTIDNMIFMFEYDRESYITDEVCYIWRHDTKGNVNIRCGGKVIAKDGNTYRICGYHQDYTDILKLKYCMKNKEEMQSNKKLEKANYLKEYYKELAYVDELTGIVNRRGFFEKINNIMENRMRRAHDNLWLTIVDLDFFKQINDNYGHLNGDKVLKFLGAILKDLERQTARTYVFRYGGEEFIILMYQYELFEVKRILNNFRLRVEQSPIPIDEKMTVHITCSMGTAYLKKEKGIETGKIIYEGMQRADRALYNAKNNGRNRIEMEL